MARRTYNQACPLAKGLDLIGERWTLLIVRDLLLGPLRFTDLLDRLPGIGRNLLTTRLKRLCDLGIAEKRTLPAPAASSVYALTDHGRGLETGLLALSAWGMQRQDGPPGGHVEPDLIGLALKIAATSSSLPEQPLRHLVVIAGHPLSGVAGPNGLTIVRGDAAAPDVTLTGDVPAFVGLLRGASIDDSVARGALEVSGTRAHLARFARLYGMALATPSPG